MSLASLSVFILLVVLNVQSVDFVYDISCTAAFPCGSGGQYTLTQTAPTAGSPAGNPALVCALGDRITFNLPAAGLTAHPLEILTAGNQPFPGVTPGVVTSGSITFNCDAALQAQPAKYKCNFHPSMTNTITIGNVNAPVAPTSPAVNIPASLTQPLDMSTFGKKLGLGNGMTFYWSVPSGDFLDFGFTAVTGSAPGWVGLGFSRTDNFQMKGSDAFIGYVITASNPPTASLKGYILASKDLSANGINVNEGITIVSGSASYVNGVSSFKVQRKLSEGYNPIAINELGQMNVMIIASYSSDPNPGVNQKHDYRIENGIYLNLLTGQNEVSYRYAIPVRIAHGVCMGTAYALLFPLGLVVARYGKSESGTWFKVHFFLQNYAFIIMLVGVIIGYTLPDPGLHFKSFTYHGGLGTAIFVLTIIQLVMGYARPHKEKAEKPSVPRKVFEFIHHWLGRSILIIAIAQIAAGIRELGVDSFAYGVWVPFLATIFFVSIGLEVRERLKEARKGDGGNSAYNLLT